MILGSFSREKHKNLLRISARTPYLSKNEGNSLSDGEKACGAMPSNRACPATVFKPLCVVESCELPYVSVLTKNIRDSKNGTASKPDV